MQEVDKTLHHYIETAILPCYKGFDKAHGPDHVNAVIENSFELAVELDVDVNMVYVIAAYHDIGIQFGRENHEKASGKLMSEDRELSRWFSSEQIKIMREAVEDHRASSQAEPRSIYGKIISEADRDIEPERIVRRSIEYGRAHFPQYSEKQLIQRSISHITEKYGDSGYLQLWLPCRKNQEGLQVLREWLKTGEIVAQCKKHL